MSQNGQTKFKNLAANDARLLKFVSPFGTLYIERLKSQYSELERFDYKTGVLRITGTRN